MNYDNSELLDIHSSSDYEEVKAVVKKIYEEFQKIQDFNGRVTVQQKHIKLIILNLYVAWLTDPTMWVAYSRNNNDYKPKSRYNKLHISKTVPEVVDHLIEVGYVEHKMGHYGRDGKHSSHVSRMRATKKLASLFKKSGIELEMIDPAPNTECIILRNINDEGKKYDMEYEDQDFIKEMRKDLYAYNNLLRRTFIDIAFFPPKGIPVKTKKDSGKPKYHRINRADKFVRRIFNNGNWDEGGRFYGGWWQRVPGKRKVGVAWRAGISINGNRTGELDYSGLHIVLLYLLKGVDYWTVDGRDPYEIEGLPTSPEMRNLLKLILLSSINAKSLEATRKSVQQQINYDDEMKDWLKSENVKVKEVILKFQDRHALIQEDFSSGIGTKLMYLDSKIAATVINHFTSKNIPILCIHDSFVIEVQHGEELKKVMNTAIQDQFPDVVVTSKMKGWEKDFIWSESSNDNDRLVLEAEEKGYEDPDWKGRRSRFLERNYEEVYFKGE